MAGGGPPRKSHTKSRTGCATCKRRHIRCDENGPQCNNCTKHNVRCDYQDAANPKKSPQVPDLADLSITPEIQRELNLWKETGQFPFPDLGLSAFPPPTQFSNADLRLLHHIATVGSQMVSTQRGGQGLWTHRVPLAPTDPDNPSFLKVALKHAFVMHALLGMSAAHLSWLTACKSALQLSYEHKGVALYGLKEAVGQFSKENADAILAASMLLSWQATEPQSWALLMQGTTTVMDAMTEWKHESVFHDLIDERDLFPREHPTRYPNLQDDLECLQQIQLALQQLDPYLVGCQHEEIAGLHGLQAFIQTLIAHSPIITPEQQFDLLHPLRAWLFCLPIALLRRVRTDIDVMVILAHYYAVCLAIQPFFPAVGAQYFGTMAIGPIEEIHKALVHGPDQSARVQWAINLMEFPMKMVAAFKHRMGWRRVVSASPLIEFADMTTSEPYAAEAAAIVSSAALGEPVIAPAANPMMMYSALDITPLSVNPGFDAGAIATFGFGGPPSPQTMNPMDSMLTPHTPI